MDNLKKIAVRTGIVLTGVCAVVLLGAGKVTSGTLLTSTGFKFLDQVTYLFSSFLSQAAPS